MNQSQTIALYQPLLQSIAYKMVGSLADAEDIVQDTLMKWLTIDTKKINNTKAYLITSVKNNCLNHIEKIKRTRDECLQNLNPADLIDWYKEKEFFNFDLDNEVSAALTVLHKKLEPIERGIFVLRELFDFDYDELQSIFDKKKDNCRKLLSRAKEKLSQETSKENVTDQSFFSSFKKACNIGPTHDFIDKVKKEISAN
ncbi:sigma-70 family RNA polymerase sigma factor [Fulvivirga sp. RKSG066]|uniref:sigma-70 family RNA polymerase sigma factor n=1 Tax=Fulvivirga aurantia TaxID=2529383 RepID=UPI0012BC6B1A|nr:sigma-70 family RNA polymerase sigma factor [Fulvivirga aurantia]MTI20500.1 sigma-70 family RNA polymerase sigma factor [Fulvivirga aurantia]